MVARGYEGTELLEDKDRTQEGDKAALSNLRDRAQSYICLFSG